MPGVEGMGDILNFDPNRKLEFDPDRELEFNPDRQRGFQPGRDLEFNSNRDLGFGQRGVVFRGYVCPICGALVSADAPKCNECGAVFETEPRASKPAVPSGPSAPPRESRGAQVAPPARTTGPAGPKALCAYCGAKLHAGDSFCWNCGTRAAGGAEVVRLPSRRPEPVTRDWRGLEEK